MDPGHLEIPIVRQCELLSLPRSTYYYNPREPDTYNDLLMRLIDEQYTKAPFYGVPRITEWLKRQGHPVNRKRIGRLMRVMGLEGICPKRNLSQASKEHKIYPYLLRGLEIDHPDQVWCSDITYIRLRQGFVYLVAVMDWFSRYVLSWELSVTLDRDFCVRALDKALEISRPEIFNTDQGSQFTSKDFTDRLKDHNIRISMDGRGRAFDNIFIERLWRTIKYEEVYLRDYQNVKDALSSLYEYFLFYDKERLHSSLGYCTAGEVYFKDRLVLPTEN